MGFLKSIRRALAKVQASPTSGLGRGFFVSIYQRLKEKIISGYEFISGKFKRIKNWIIDTSTGEVIEEIKPKYIGKALKNFIVDTLCANVLYEKPSDLKGQVIRALKVFGITGLLAGSLIVAEGMALSALLILKVIVLLYLILVIGQLAFYLYEILDEGRDKTSASEPIEGEVLSVAFESDVGEQVPDAANPWDSCLSDEAVADEETFDNEFFTSEEEEKKFHHELADFVRSKNLRPELVYYMFCYEKKAKNTKLDNDITNFLMAPDNSEAVIKFIGRYPKLSKSIMPNGYLDTTYSKSFNRYLLPIMFEPNSSLTLARYTKYFYRLVKI